MSRIMTILEYIGKKDNKIIYNEMKQGERYSPFGKS